LRADVVDDALDVPGRIDQRDLAGAARADRVDEILHRPAGDLFEEELVGRRVAHVVYPARGEVACQTRGPSSSEWGRCGTGPGWTRRSGIRRSPRNSWPPRSRAPPPTPGARSSWPRPSSSAASRRWPRPTT